MSPNRIQFQRHTFDTLEFASPWLRAISLVLDGACAVGIAFGLRSFYSHTFAIAGLSFATLNLWWMMWLSSAGATPAMMLCRIHVYAPRRDRGPDFIQVAYRILGFWLSILCAGIGFTLALTRRDRRTWSEIFSETIVLGNKTRNPSRFEIFLGRALQTTQIVVLFCLFIAAPLSPHSFDGAVNWVTAKNVQSSAHCMDPRLMIEKPSEVLAALVYSPAWAQCWDETQYGMSAISDSQLFWVAKLARLYHNLSNLSSDRARNAEIARIETMNHQWCIVNGCDEKSKTSPALHYWVQDHAENVTQFLSAHNRTERLEQLRATLATETSPLIRNAIEERIWSESAFNATTTPRLSGLLSGLAPEFAYEPWVARQICWMAALGTITESACNQPDFLDAIDTLASARTDDLAVEDVESTLAEFKSNHLPAEFQEAFLAMNAAHEGNFETADEHAARVPETSPLYTWVHDRLTVTRGTAGE